MYILLRWVLFSMFVHIIKVSVINKTDQIAMQIRNSRLLSNAYSTRVIRFNIIGGGISSVSREGPIKEGKKTFKMRLFRKPLPPLCECMSDFF